VLPDGQRFHLEKSRLRWEPIKVYKCLEGECKEDGRGLTPLVHSETRQWAQTETQEVPPEYQETLL